ncbi:MAG TPA: hypothetical protein VFY23_10795 [Candidatus Limnocylindrales bacterium]|nr:hypothetical protein [Candidatus Limnocylindrales bacterium]
MRERELPTLPAWMAPLVMVGIVIVAVLLIGGRGAAGTAADPAVGAARVTTTDDGAFRLTLQAEHGTYEPGAVISPGASLVYLGPKPSTTVMGVPGTVLFAVKKVGGSRRIDPAPATTCVPTTLDRGVTIYQPWAATGAPELVLPDGDWRLSAIASFAEGPDCQTGPFHALEASIVVTVRADPATTLTP